MVRLMTAPPSIEAIGVMNVDELRTAWRDHFDDEPRMRTPSLLRQEFAWRVQVQHQGDMDARLKQRLARLARQGEGSKKPTRASPKMSPGSTLVKEWDGVAYRVTILKEGYAFEGEVYRSLSVIARRITGVHWSGPRFFGLLDRAKA
jgi:hypothetical protein